MQKRLAFFVELSFAEWSEKQARVGKAGLNPRPRTRRNGWHLTVHFIYTLYTILQKGSTFLTVLLRYIFGWIFLRFCRERIFYSTSASLHLCIYPHEIGVLLYLHRLMYARKSLLKFCAHLRWASVPNSVHHHLVKKGCNQFRSHSYQSQTSTSRNLNF